MNKIKKQFSDFLANRIPWVYFYDKTFGIDSGKDSITTHILIEILKELQFMNDKTFNKNEIQNKKEN